MTPKEILAENYDQIEGICRRLPVGEALMWGPDDFWYARESTVIPVTWEGREQFDEALSKKQKGQRLVVIVTPSETLYQFV